MTNEQKQVQEFMQTFGQETPATPCIPSFEVRKLRAKLILEEALETIEALGFKPMLVLSDLKNAWVEGDITVNNIKLRNGEEPNLNVIADGLADLHYVAYCGTALACGLDVEPIFREVHRSNMSKLWSYEEVKSKGNLDNYDMLSLVGELINFDNGDTADEMDNHKWLVKNKEGKVIKSPSYSPANLAPLIEAQKNP